MKITHIPYTLTDKARAALDAAAEFHEFDYTPAYVFRWAWMHFYGTATDRRYISEGQGLRATPAHCKSLVIATLLLRYTYQQLPGYKTAMSNRYTVHALVPSNSYAICGSLATVGQSVGFLPVDCKACNKKLNSLHRWAKNVSGL